MSAHGGQRNIVGELYNSALDDAAWAKLPQLLTEEIDGESAVLWVREGSQRFEGMIHNLGQEALALYGGHYRHIDPWATAAMRHRLYSTAFVGSELVPDLAVRQTEFYTDFARKIGAAQIAGGGVALESGICIGVGIHRPHGVSAFRTAQKNRLQALLPHLGQVVRLRRRLSDNADTARAGSVALDALSVGVLVCDASGRVLFANRAAEAAAATGDAVVLGSRGGSIAARRQEQTKRLLRLVHAASSGSAGGGLCLDGADGKRMFVLVNPLPGELGGEAGRALVTLRAETDRPCVQTDTLSAMFGLTRAEAQLALALLDNRSLAQIREERGVTENTVRTQLTQLFRKTEVANQRELVRLLSLLPPVFLGSMN